MPLKAAHQGFFKSHFFHLVLNMEVPIELVRSVQGLPLLCNKIWRANSILYRSVIFRFVCPSPSPHTYPYSYWLWKKQSLHFIFPTHESKKAALKIFIQNMLLWMHTIFIIYKYLPQTFFHYLLLCGMILRGGSLYLYINCKAYMGSVELPNNCA